MKPDLISSNPRHLDYPLFRLRLPEWEQYFNKVYIALTEGLEPDISSFLLNCPEYKNVKWVRPPKGDGREDWRNLAVRDMLLNF
ncbi:MAG: hypothetical protein AABY22_14095, partial [Nanoarchaeota archaeon]